jgi:hypothetical protein
MDILRKTYAKYGGGFSKAKFWSIKHDGAWRQTDRVFEKRGDQWELVHAPEGLFEIEITLNGEGSWKDGLGEGVDLFDQAVRETPFSADLLSTYPFSITVNIGVGEVLLGRLLHVATSLASDGKEVLKPALTIGRFGEGTTVHINNYGTIVGRGGKGGTAVCPHRAFDADIGPFQWHQLGNVHGENGGNAIEVVDTTVTIHNYGDIWGGGGGGTAGMPIIRAYMNYIEQRGGPNKGIPGVGGVMNGEAIVDSWMVMDFGNGGAGGGGAPYGSVGDFDAGEEFLGEPIPIHKIESDYKEIALVLNQYVFTPKCAEGAKVVHFATNGLDPDSIGSDTYYDPDQAASPRPVTDSSYEELQASDTNSWQVYGTWLGPFWPPDPFPTSDYVTRLITVRGSTVWSYNSRNLDLTVTPAQAGEGYVSKVGGAGGSTVFNAGKPDSDDFNGKYQGDDDCTVNVNTRVNGATDNGFYGNVLAVGGDGAVIGERAVIRTAEGGKVASPYSSLPPANGVYLGSIPATTFVDRGHAGWAILSDSDSTVSYVDKGGELKGREDYD